MFKKLALSLLAFVFVGHNVAEAVPVHKRRSRVIQASATATPTATPTPTASPTPAFINLFGFENQGASNDGECQGSAGTFSVTSSFKRSGTAGFRSNPTTTATGHCQTGFQGSTGRGTTFSVTKLCFTTYFCAKTLPSSGDEEFLSIRRSGGEAFTMRASNTGAINVYDDGGAGSGTNLLTTLTNTISAHTCDGATQADFTQIEACVNQSTTGAYEIKINGAVDKSGTGNFGSAAFEGFTIGKRTNRNGNTVDFIYDDIQTDSAWYPGAIQCLWMAPNAAGSTNQWQAASCTNGCTYTETTQIPKDDDTTYLKSTGSAGDVVSLNLQDTGTVGISGAIKGIKAACALREDTSVTSAQFCGVNSAGTTSDNSSGFNGSTTYAWIFKPMDKDPATSTFFTTSGLDALQVRAREGNAVASRDTSMGVTVCFNSGGAPTATPTNTPTPTATPTATVTPTATSTPTPDQSGQSASPLEDTTSFLRNPDIGFQSNQQTETDTNNAGNNPDGYPLSVANYRACWKDIESSQGSYNFTTYTDFLARAQADLQTVNLRMYETDPGDLCGAPTYQRTGTNFSGWLATSDDGGSTQMNYACWNDSDNRTAYQSVVSAYATAIAPYPAVGVVDQSYWGSYNEVNSADTHYVSGSATGVAPIPGVGSNLPTPLPTPKAQLIPIQPTIFPNTLGVTFPDDSASFTLGVNSGLGVRADGWGYRNVVTNPAQTPGSCTSGSVQMNTLYKNTFAGNYSSCVGVGTPTPTPGASYPNVWQTKPLILEPFGTFSNWASQSYPYNASFNWALDNHASQINCKGQFNPTSSWDSAFQNLQRKLGYRHYISNISHQSTATNGVPFNISTTWVNHGVAPSYLGHKILFRFSLVGGTDIYKVATSTTANWQPNASTPVSSAIILPDWLNPGTYRVAVGLGDATTLIPKQFLAVQSVLPPPDLWYDFGTQIAVSNASPTTNPTTDYACGFASASSQYLSRADSNPMSFNGTSMGGAARVYLASKSGNMVVVAKGNHASSSQEFAVWYDSSADRFKFTVSNGSTVYTATANTFGAPSINTWYNLLWTFNNSTKQLRLKVNNGTADTATATGSIQNTSSELRVGASGTGAAGTFWNGRLDKIRLWKKLLSSDEETEIYGEYVAGDGTRLQDLSQETKRGNYVSLECDEASGNRADSFQVWNTFTDNNGVTQADAGVTQLD